MYGMTERILIPRSVDDIINDNACLENFNKFLSDKSLPYELNCYIDVRQLNSVQFNTGEWSVLAQKISDKYLLPFSEQRVSLGHLHATASIEPQLTPALFSSMASDLLQVLQSSFQEFKKTSQFKDMIETLQRRQSVTGQLQGSSLIYALWQRLSSASNLSQRYIAVN